MSQFSEVAAAPSTSASAEYLDRTARSLGAMKRYIVGAHVLAGARVVLDVGCGVGHDLELLARADIAPIGVEPNGDFATRARTRARAHGASGAVLRARGEQLPFRDGAVDGCRIERVLQHAFEPLRLVREACRCVRPGGLITIFEPDWTTMRVESEQFASEAAWLVSVRHPNIGANLHRIVEECECLILDVVEEHSVWPTIARARVGINIEAALARSVQRGEMSEADAAAWLREQRARDCAGQFRATLTKRLVVATVR